MKKCSVCKEEKSLNKFYKDADKKDGYRLDCIICHEEKRKFKPKLESNISVEKAICTQCNIEKLASEFHRNKRHSIGLVRQCKECRKNKTKNFYEKNKERIKSRVKVYNKENREKIRPAKNAYQNRKMKEDPFYVLSRRLRNRLYYALKKKSWKKNTKFFKYIGCTLEELKIHIEKQFQPGMSWELKNFHIDHKTPLVSAKTPEEMYKLCHYTNLQPLWAVDNLSKGSKTCT